MVECQLPKLPAGDGSVCGDAASEGGVAGDSSFDSSAMRERVDGDPQLAELVDRWSELSSATRAGILAMVREFGRE